MPWQYVEGDETKSMSQTTETNTTQTKQETYEKLYGQQQTQEQQTQQTTPPPAAPTQVTLPEELTSALGMIPKLAEEVTTLKQKLAPPPPPSDPEEWVEKIRTGDFKGARQALFQEFRKEVDPELVRNRTEAEQRALQAMQIQTSIESHLNQVRSANPDIVPYERYLKPLVDAAVAQEVQSGKIKTPEQYVSAYRRAAETEVESLRNLRLQERAGGKQEALTRTKEVLSSTPLAPNQATNRTAQAEQESVTDVSTPEARLDYITQRQQKMNRSRGIGG